MASVNGNAYDKSALPEDLWIEIFIRSSVESLLRVKCVCKHWYGLIKAHSFERKYLEYQKSLKQNRLLLQYFNDEDREFNYTIVDEDAQSSSTYDSLEYLAVPNEIVDIQGPVNGLYCLFNTFGRCVLWNPASMEFKIVPLPPPHILPHYKVLGAYVGFGVGSLINDRKVVIVRHFIKLREHGDGVFDEVVVNLYNLTTNTWRPFDLGDFLLPAFSINHNTSSSFLNGTYHWWMFSGVVLAFDMEIETFRMIPGPCFSQSDFASDLASSAFLGTLAIYDEHVALLRCDVRGDNYSLDIWVMLEEGIWFKQFRIGPFVEVMLVLGFWRKDRLLLVFSNTESDLLITRMVFYDVITQEMINVGPKGYQFKFRTCDYYESLASLNSGNECDVYMVSDFLNKGTY